MFILNLAISLMRGMKFLAPGIILEVAIYDEYKIYNTFGSYAKAFRYFLLSVIFLNQNLTASCNM
jgi:hypothetical protein